MADIGRFHHCAETRTCLKCGNALGSKDHEEECKSEEEQEEALIARTLNVQTLRRHVEIHWKFEF